MTFFYPAPTYEGEYFDVESKNDMNERLQERQERVYQAIFFMSSIKTEHKRDAFDFLLFLANIGGVQLVLDLFCSKILRNSQKHKTLYDTIKKFFHVKSINEEGMLGHQHDQGNESHYQFKLDHNFKIKMAGMNSICCCICKMFSKDHKKLDHLLHHGEHKL